MATEAKEASTLSVGGEAVSSIKTETVMNNAVRNLSPTIIIQDSIKPSAVRKKNCRDLFATVLKETSLLSGAGKSASLKKTQTVKNDDVRNVTPTIIIQDKIKTGDGDVRKKSYRDRIDYTPYMTEKDRPRVLVITRESETVTKISAFGSSRAQAELSLIIRDEGGIETLSGRKKNYRVDYSPFVTGQNKSRLLVISRVSETITKISAFGPIKAEADLNLIIQEDGGLDTMSVVVDSIISVSNTGRIQRVCEEVEEKVANLELSDKNDGHPPSCNENEARSPSCNGSDARSPPCNKNEGQPPSCNENGSQPASCNEESNSPICELMKEGGQCTQTTPNVVDHTHKPVVGIVTQELTSGSSVVASGNIKN